MHRVIKSFVKSFSEDYQLDDYSPDKQFEFFCNHCIIQSKAMSSIEAEFVTVDSHDNGIDGLAVIVDGEVINSVEEVEQIFGKQTRKFEVEIVFVQAKSGEKFDLTKFARFSTGVNRFVGELSYEFESENLSAQHEIYKFLLDNASQVKNSLPKISVFFVTTGRYTEAIEWEDEKESLIKRLSKTGYCHEPEVFIWGYEELTNCWNQLNSDYKAKLPFFSAATLPEMPAVNQAYLGVVKAQDLVDNLLLNSDGIMRSQVFEENVRSFLGGENPINEKISKTIKSDYQLRFPVLNNGVTIVSPAVTYAAGNFFMEKYQIVNGCQTCNVLYQNRDELADLMVTVKVVETQNEDVFVQLVNATNSQTKVDDAQFNSLSPVARRVEHYFKAMEENNSQALYFERRDKQFVGSDNIPYLRTYSLKEASRCVAAMFLGRPDLASRFPLRMFRELSSQLYDNKIHEVVYYAACMAMHRFKLLRSNKTIPKDLQRFKWHFLPLVRMEVCGSDHFALTDKRIVGQCEKLISELSSHGPNAVKVFDSVSKTMQNFQDANLDKLKRLSTFEEMKATHLNMRQ